MDNNLQGVETRSVSRSSRVHAPEAKPLIFSVGFQSGARGICGERVRDKDMGLRSGLRYARDEAAEQVLDTGTE